MGFRGVPSADIFFEDVAISADAGEVLLPAGSFGKMMQAFCLERCGNAGTRAVLSSCTAIFCHAEGFHM
jgi:hypothetical protein